MILYKYHGQMSLYNFEHGLRLEVIIIRSSYMCDVVTSLLQLGSVTGVSFTFALAPGQSGLATDGVPSSGLVACVSPFLLASSVETTVRTGWVSFSRLHCLVGTSFCCRYWSILVYQVNANHTIPNFPADKYFNFRIAACCILRIRICPPWEYV